MPIIMNKGMFFKGLVSLILFLSLLIPLFSPVFNGQTGMQYADDLFNSLSKGSAYYIPEVAEDAKSLQGKSLDTTIKVNDPAHTELTAKLFEGAGAQVAVNGNEVQVKGDLGAIVQAAVIDADNLFTEQEAAIQTRYGEDARLVLYTWYNTFSQMEKNLLHDGYTEESLFLKKVSVRALEPSYNFAGITAAKVSERAGITIFLFAFYVFYTVWYGFSIMFLFEGLGITASKAKHA